jgi:hypothetical protein
VLARRYLSIQATSAESERVFSLAGLLVDKRQTRLRGDLTDMIIYLQSTATCFAKRNKESGSAAACPPAQR